MKLKLLITLLLLSVGFCASFSQGLRSLSMGGITIPLKDPDNSLDPYDMGGNISFLYLDELSSWLKISPSLNSDWGDYRRPLDADNVNLYGINFTGLKTLGTDGTFIGSVSYIYDSRINVHHSVRYNTYQGSAFYINDSTSGNILYNGPAVKFGYSFELLSDLFLGASGGYKILNGLKDIYSQTSTVLRDVDGSLGITYKIYDFIYWSAGFSIFNTQESLTTALPNPVDDEIFNYHGDTYNLTNRGNPWLEKIKERGNSWNSQLYIKPDINSEIGLNFVYSNSNQKVLFQKTVSGVTVLENEDGYSYFNGYLIDLKARYDIFSDLTIGFKGSWLYNRSWSKLSAQELLIWDWNSKNAEAGLGASYKILPSLLLNVEYDFSRVQADSSKYIDYHFNSVSSNDHIFRLGAEYEIFNKIFLRGGAGYGMIANDIIFGGRNIKYGLATFGLGFNLFESFSIDILLDYNNYKPKQLDYSHSFFNGLITLKLFNI